jgi:hypothetical protein
MLEAYDEWKRAYALRFSMYEWADNFHRQADMCAELQRTLDVDDALMARVHKRGRWYLIPYNSYLDLQADIDVTHAALVADVCTYHAEDAAFEAAHRKRRREALKAERAAAPPAPARTQPPRASKRARGSA